MKKFAGIILIFLLCLVVMMGCSKQAAPSNDSQEKEAEKPSEIRYADLIPDPSASFPNGTITVTDADGGKAYMFNVVNYNDDEYEAFVSGCKEFGFDDISYETSHEKGKDFGAYTTDGEYWIQVNQDSEKDIIYVTCQESKKK